MNLKYLHRSQRRDNDRDGTEIQTILGNMLFEESLKCKTTTKTAWIICLGSPVSKQNDSATSANPPAARALSLEGLPAMVFTRKLAFPLPILPSARLCQRDDPPPGRQYKPLRRPGNRRRTGIPRRRNPLPSLPPFRLDGPPKQSASPFIGP